jgi:hypothetical protein
MNIETMLRELREEHEGVEQAILVLERIASTRAIFAVDARPHG